MAKPVKALKDLNESELQEVKAKIEEYKVNARLRKYPAIYAVSNRRGKSECHEFLGALGGSSRKNDSRPQVKFRPLSCKVTLASAMDAVYKVHADPSRGDYAFDGEISHLCHLKWCVNPHHLVREAHKVNCERRDNCSHTKCLCVTQGRCPPCI